jgi:flagellar biosynthesis/type III secretory pathway protein FliH
MPNSSRSGLSQQRQQQLIEQQKRGGSYYETNEYGADLLRQAVNNGYQEGFRAGEADRQDRWHSDYRD